MRQLAGKSADMAFALPTSVNMARSFPVSSFRTNGSTYGASDFIRAKITGGGATLSLYAAEAETQAFV